MLSLICFSLTWQKNIPFHLPLMQPIPMHYCGCCLKKDLISFIYKMILKLEPFRVFAIGSSL